MKTTDIATLYTYYTQHPVVVTDSRQIVQGCIFFALRGERFDGNRYALQALQAGAAYAVVDDAEVAAADVRCLPVENVLHTLQQLARHHRRQMNLPVIAITGTNGKTTTKELTAAVLRRKYNILYTEGNLNNHIGVPLTLLRLTAEHQLAVIEMGASKPGDIRELVEISEPNYGIITNVGLAHLAGFGSAEGVRRTKGELYDYLRAHDGRVFLHRSDETLCAMAVGIPSVDYGTTPGNGVSARLITSVRSGFLSLAWSLPQTVCPYPEKLLHTQLVGQYNLPNVLAAIAVGCFFDVSEIDILKALTEYAPANKRSQFVQTKRNRLIVDAYNANPTSMEAAIRNFCAIETECPQVAILGDMLELGEESASAHRKILDLILSLGVCSRIYLVGSEFAAVAHDVPDHVISFANVESLTEYLQAHPLSDSFILVKGSNGIHLQDLAGQC